MSFEYTLYCIPGKFSAYTFHGKVRNQDFCDQNFVDEGYANIFAFSCLCHMAIYKEIVAMLSKIDGASY